MLHRLPVTRQIKHHCKIHDMCVHKLAAAVEAEIRSVSMAWCVFRPKSVCQTLTQRHCSWTIIEGKSSSEQPNTVSHTMMPPQAQHMFAPSTLNFAGRCIQNKPLANIDDSTSCKRQKVVWLPKSVGLSGDVCILQIYGVVLKCPVDMSVQDQTSNNRLLHDAKSAVTGLVKTLSEPAWLQQQTYMRDNVNGHPQWLFPSN